MQWFMSLLTFMHKINLQNMHQNKTEFILRVVQDKTM